MAAKLRRTLDVRLVTTWVFGPRFFCGQYVLADCTDETSAKILAAIMNWIRIQFTALWSGFILASVSAFVWQHRQKFNTSCLVPLLCFLWSGFVELSVNNSSIACAMELEV